MYLYAMARQWPIKRATAGSLPVHCTSNFKGRASGVFLRWSNCSQEEEWGPVAAPYVEPGPMYAPRSCVERSQREAKKQGSLFLDGQSLSVCPEELCTGCRASQSGRLTHQPLWATTARRQTQHIHVVRTRYVHGS